jgi:hypothetical protein
MPIKWSAIIARFLPYTAGAQPLGPTPSTACVTYVVAHASMLGDSLRSGEYTFLTERREEFVPATTALRYPR